VIGIDIRITKFSFAGDNTKYEDGSPRTLETVVAHEVGHAARIINGPAATTRFGYSSTSRMVEEVAVTNLENQYRFARGIPQRQTYGGQDLRQYP